MLTNASETMVVVQRSCYAERDSSRGLYVYSIKDGGRLIYCKLYLVMFSSLWNDAVMSECGSVPLTHLSDLK